MDRIARIKQNLEVLQPQFLNITNQSLAHTDHFYNNDDLQTHLALTIYANILNDKPLVEQHRLINNLIKDEFDNGLHAFSINILSTL